MNSVEFLLKSLKPMKTSQNIKPHKFALVLAIIDMYDDGLLDTNCLVLDDELESRFHKNMGKLDSNTTKQSSFIEYPFFSLSKDGFWMFKIRPGRENEFNRIATELQERFTKRRILENIDCAVFSDEFNSVLSDPSCRALLREKLIISFTGTHTYRQQVYEPKGNIPKCFCDYLSSLISTNVYNENAIAESQVSNPMFKAIHCPHPLVKSLDRQLRQKTGKHVILTGHAGDGKTTIAVDIIKSLRGLDAGAMLEAPLDRREELDAHSLSVIKDFSERKVGEDLKLIDELKAGHRRFMIVSNTGTLLDFFKGNAGAWNRSSVEAESQILTAISQPEGSCEFELGGVEFIVYNLAYIDNLKLAQAIFERMLHAENWKGCDLCSRLEFCPIKSNVNLICSAREQVISRLFLLYRRMYEYGTRLTIRQLTSHLAYLITSGINAAQVHQNMLQMKTDFLFFNRLFGDDGKNPDTLASEMKAIVELRRQNLGTIFNPRIEMSLWQRASEHSPVKLIPVVQKQFFYLRNIGATALTFSGTGPSPEQARRQARRMLYFFSSDEEYTSRLICDFLSSPNILFWQEWQKKDAVLERAYRVRYSAMVFHVIQEHFTGVRMPEASGSQDSRLYITLSRKQSEVRQSTQIVMAELDWSQNVSLELEKTKNATGAEFAELILKGQGLSEGVNLKLGLPFLDYVTQRHYGEIGNLLNAAYKERLEHFKLQVLKKTSSLSDDMMLIRLRNDNRFKRQKYSISDQVLEVFDD